MLTRLMASLLLVEVECTFYPYVMKLVSAERHWSFSVDRHFLTIELVAIFLLPLSGQLQTTQSRQGSI